MHEKFKPIAIVGLGAIFPGASNVHEFWRNILQAKDLITPVPADHWLIEDYYDPDPLAVDKTYGKSGAFIPDVDFDPMEFGIPPNNLPAIDTAQLLALIVAKQVLKDTFSDKWQGTDLSRISVILGSSSLEAIQHISGRMQRPIWAKVLRASGFSESIVQQVCDKIAAAYTGWQENTFPGLLPNVIAGRVANRFDLGGTNCTVDAACAGSLAALSMAIQELQIGSADMVISGGVDALNDIIMFMCFSKVGALSISGNCSPFSKEADGTVLGEGVGMFALKRLSDAERDRNKIYALIKGLGTSSDGKSKSIYAPVALGQSKAILRAYEMAGFSPDTIELIEAHGTGTRAGDVAEFEGLNLAFQRDANTKKRYCALGSIKSQIGHTKAASGSAGLFKAAMALHHKILPPTIHIKTPDPRLNIEDTPFYLNTETRPWFMHSESPRRAGVSSFGFGGSNFHVALEEYLGPLSAPRLRGMFVTELIILAAEDPSTLKEQCEQLLQQDSNALNVSFLAQQSQQQASSHLLARLGIVAVSVDDLKAKLKQAITLIETSTTTNFLAQKDIFYGYGVNPGCVAFLFPGQGSQYVNMAKDLIMAFPQALEQWTAAMKTDCLAGMELAQKVFPILGFTPDHNLVSEKNLMATHIAQPALAVTNLIYLKLLTQVGILPDAVAGHSFGELSALSAAGIVDEATLFAMAQKRGELLHQASMANPGAMLSVAAYTDEVLALLKKVNLNLTAANFNAPQQLVLSGAIAEIEKLEQLLQQANKRFVRLPVATGFHSPLVQSGYQAFYDYLKSLSYRAPVLNVYANQTAEVYPDSPETIPKILADQIVNPVKFQQMIEALYEKGVRTFIEVGPNTILSGLVKQCLGDRTHWSVSLDAKNEQGVTAWWRAMARLFVIGLNPDFSTLWKNFELPATSTSKNPHTLKINGTNYGRPYPPVKQEKADLKLKAVLASEALKTEIKAPVLDLEQVMNAPFVPSPTTETLRGNTMSQTNHPATPSIYQELQRQLIESHNTYQKTMADAHMTFLHTIGQLGQQAMGNPDTKMTLGSALSPSLAQPISVPPSVMPSMPVAPPRTPWVPPSPVVPTPTFISEAVMPSVAPTLSPVVPTPTASAPVKVSTEQTLKDFVLDTVVNKTGYPREMLNIDMDIEADLGIDSIKRVEIFSALSEKIPKVATINPNQLSDFRTLASILNYVEAEVA